MGAPALQVGIDSYSYHRRYGEARAGEAPTHHESWPLEPTEIGAGGGVGAIVESPSIGIVGGAAWVSTARVLAVGWL